MALDPEITFHLRPDITLVATSLEGARDQATRLLEEIFQSDEVLAVECDQPALESPA